VVRRSSSSSSGSSSSQRRNRSMHHAGCGSGSSVGSLQHTGSAGAVEGGTHESTGVSVLQRQQWLHSSAALPLWCG
jgi:hypothetical protein